jgi:hypothetical protein
MWKVGDLAFLLVWLRKLPQQFTTLYSEKESLEEQFNLQYTYL